MAQTDPPPAAASAALPPRPSPPSSPRAARSPRSGPLSATDVTLTGGFWADRCDSQPGADDPGRFRAAHDVGTLENFRLAARPARDGYRALGIMFDKPFPFLDSDVYKWLEARRLGARPGGRSPGSRPMADEAIGLVAAAQRPDGYLNTFVQVLAAGASTRTSMRPRALLLRPSHPGRCRLAPRARRRPSPPRRRARGRLRRAGVRAGRRSDGFDGHPEIEMALVELFRVDRRAALAGPRRGVHRPARPRLAREGPVRERLLAGPPAGPRGAVGRRATRCDSCTSTAGAVDVAVETGDRELLDAVRRRWRDMVATQMYLTGALGSRHKDEAFGDPYELPPDRAYAETCAAIACDDARLAAAARDRRSGLRRRDRADCLQRDPAVAVARRDGVLLRQPAAAADARGLVGP